MFKKSNGNEAVGYAESLMDIKSEKIIQINWGTIIKENIMNIQETLADVFCDQATFSKPNTDNTILIIMDDEGLLHTVEVIGEDELHKIVTSIGDKEIFLCKINMFAIDEPVAVLKVFLRLMRDQSEELSLNYSSKYSEFNDFANGMNEYPELKEEAQKIILSDELTAFNEMMSHYLNDLSNELDDAFQKSLGFFKDFHAKHPDDHFQIMSPSGYFYIHPDNNREKLVASSGGDSYMEVSWDELNSQPIEEAFFNSNEKCWHMMTGYPNRDQNKFVNQQISEPNDDSWDHENDWDRDR